MALVVMTEAKPREALESLLRKTAYILIPYSVLLIKYYPALGVDYGRWSGLQMWVGVTVQKNTLGRLCLLTAFFLIWALFRHWRQVAENRNPHVWASDLLILAVTLYLLKGADNAYSATSIVTFAVGLGTFSSLKWCKMQGLRVPRPVLLGVLLVLLSLGVTAPFVGGSNLSPVSSTLGRDETLTGRTDTWRELVPVAKQRLLAGVGFGSFWTTARRDYYEMSHGHNGYLDTLLELGVVGLLLYVIWLMIVASGLHGALGAPDDWGTLAIGLLFMAVVYNFAESTFNSVTEQMTAIVVFSAMVVPNEPGSSMRRSRVGMRLHVPAQRTSGTSTADSRPAEDGGQLQVLDRRRRQRHQRPSLSRGRGGTVGTGA
jgi:O-antigen ligase